MPSEKSPVFEIIAQALSIVAGMTMFFLGWAGLLDWPVRPKEELTAVLRPSGLGSNFDILYWSVTTTVGGFLILGFHVRTSAILGVAMVAGKTVYLGMS